MVRPSSLKLDGYSSKQLKEIQKAVAQAIIEAEKTEREEVRAQLTAILSNAGMNIDDVFGSKKPRKAGAKGTVAVKYRNPENADETWSGRGRMAKWLSLKMKKRGAKIEDFAV